MSEHSTNRDSNTTPGDGWVFQAVKAETVCKGRDHNYYVSGYNTITQQKGTTSFIRAQSEEYAIKQYKLNLGNAASDSERNKAK